MDDIRLWGIWLQAHWATARHSTADESSGRDERGFTAIEWLMVALGVITIAGIAVAAVKNYVTGQTQQLGSP